MRIKAIVIILIIAGFIIAISSQFSVAIDTPHNESNNVSCGGCHVGLNFLVSPYRIPSYTPQTIDDTPFNMLCLSCHVASSGPYTETSAPKVKTHSSVSISNKYGDWTRECRNCHNPHFQLQKNYKSTDASSLYLAQGTITSCVYNGDGTSTLTYSTITYKTGWDANKLTKKTEDYRYAVLWPDVNKPDYDYPITAVDSIAKTIRVKGNATINLSPPTTFAVMYGQYVKNSIKVGGSYKTVKFFDQTGTNSFSDGDTTYNSICEVCHTQTKHFRNAAGAPDQNHANIDGSGVGGEKCTFCHPHSEGFKPNCNACHGNPPGGQFVFRNKHLVFLDKVGNPVTSDSPGVGSHAIHINAGYKCSNCHTGGMLEGAPQGDNLINIGFYLNSKNLGGSYDGKPGRTYYQYAGGGTTTVTVGNTLECSNICCHSDGTDVWTGGSPTGTSPPWGSTGAGCNECHGNSTYTDYRKAAPLYASGSPKPNAHQLHTDVRGTPSNEPQCKHCHSTVTATNTAIDGTIPSNHVNNAYNVLAGSTYKDGDNVGGAAVAVTTTYNYSGTPNSSTCSNVSCHPTGIAGTKASSTTKWSNAYSCTDCHKIDMNNTSGYHHVMDTTALSNRTYPTAHGSTIRKCTMCHVDHDIFSPMLNSNAALTQPRAMNLRTSIGTVPTKSSGFANSDYISGGGICISCHGNSTCLACHAALGGMPKNNPNQKNDGTTAAMIVTDAQFSTSAHQYNVVSTMSNGGATFNANCSKCHNAKNGETTTFQSSTNKFGTHDNTVRRLYASLGTTLTDGNDEQFCYRCHSKTSDTNPGGGPAKGTAGRDYYGTAGATITASAEDIFTVMQKGTAGTAEVTTSTNTLYFKSASDAIPSEPMSNAFILASGTYSGTTTYMGRAMTPNQGTTAENRAQTTSTTANRFYRIAQFTSPAVKNAVSFTTAQTFTLYFSSQESNINANMYVRYALWVWNSNDTQGTNWRSVATGAQEVGNNTTSKLMQTITFNPSSNFTLNASEKVLLEVEFMNTGTTSCTVTGYWGDATDNSRLVFPSNVDFISTPATPANGRHDVASYSGEHKPSPKDETLAYISANKHVECADCHNPHAAGATKHTKGTNAVSPVLASVSGATPTSWGTYGTTTSSTLYLRNNAAINAVPPTRPVAYKYSSGTYTTNTFNDRDMTPTSGATTASTNISTGSTAARYDRGLQFVSPQIDQAVTIPSGSTFTLTIRESRATGTSTDYTRFTAYKWDGATATPLNTSAAPNNYGQNATAISTTATNRSTTFTSNQAVTLNPGDSLICDVEFYHSAGTTALNVTYAYGNFGTDAAALALPAGTYVWRTDPAANWTAPSSYTLQAATYEYEICFKCHSGANTNNATWGGTNAASWTNVGLEFSPNNRSGHPIVTGLNNYPNSLPPKALVAAQILAPWNVNLGTQTMYCTDCHETDSVASKGPHASAVKWMLAGTNKAWPYQNYSNNGGSTGTYWTLSNRNTNSGTANGLFCLNCHPVGGTNNTHSDSNHNSYRCVDCHIRVPHGGKVSRLITTHQAGYGLPARYFPDGKGGGVGSDPMGKFTKASSPTGYDTPNCDANCHGSHQNTTGESW